MTYADKLKDPRWQKKRLEILERDDFTCQLCRDKTTTLHIHHFCYAISRNPWESEDHELITYCECCHALATHLSKDKKDDFIIYAIKHKFENHSDILCLIAATDYERCFAIFKYEKGFITIETVLTLQMVEDLYSIIQMRKQLFENV